MTKLVSLEFDVSDQLCADIMSTALEGGIGYWAQADAIMRTPENAEGSFDYVACFIAELNDDESGYDWDNRYRLDYSVIRLGLQRLTQGTVKVNSEIKRDIYTAITENDAGFIDADGADCIVQAGLLGEIRYG
jgi:hypothetical protein